MNISINENSGLKWPARLKMGDKAALIAPASPASEDSLNDAVASLKFLGLVPEIYPSCHMKYGYLAGSDEDRATDINKAFADDSIKAVFCLRGGYGTPRLLNLLDYDMIACHPKVFCGYSDITALHTVFNKKCGFVTFHSPMPSAGYHKMDYISLDSIASAIFGKPCDISLQNPYGQKIEKICGGTASGILTGGNLSLLLSTLGSPHAVDTTGKILFIEEVDEELYKVDRALTALSNAGLFSHASGVILGSFSGCKRTNSTEDSLTLTQIFTDVLGSLCIPVISGFCAGHKYPNLTLPLGAEITLSV